EAVAHDRRVALVVGHGFAERLGAGREVGEDAAVLEPELAAAAQAEAGVAGLRRTELEQRGEMRRGDLPAVFQVAAIDAELVEQRLGRNLVTVEPGNGLARPL